MMNQKNIILVPVDFSFEYPLVLRTAEEKAVAANHRLLLLHVVGENSPLRQRPPLILTDPLEDCVRAIHRIPSTQVSFLTVEGDAIEEILNTAIRSGCSAIVMGRGGTKERPGHVALEIQKRFPGKLHLVSHRESETPSVAEVISEEAYHV